MEPFFFAPDERLYGAYHPPALAGFAPETAVVVCQSIGHEYMRAHRACWQFAEAAAARNAHVLRFDYYATGDSLGMPADASWSAWIDSVVEAMQWLEDRSGLNEIRLVGLRVGALLAAAAAARASGVRRIVCWDPVIRGERFLDGLLSEHVEYTREQNRYRSPRHRYAEADTDEFLGFYLPGAVIDPLSSADLDALLDGTTANCDVTLAQDAVRCEQIGTLARGGGEVVTLPDSAGWGDVRNQFRRLVLPRSIPMLVERATG